MASDLFWANFIPSYLTADGTLTQDNEAKLRMDIKRMTDNQFVTIPEDIIPHLRHLSSYVLKGAFMLNKLAKGSIIHALMLHRHLMGHASENESSRG